MPRSLLTYVVLVLVPAVLACPGDGTGLDANGNPLGPGNPPADTAVSLARDVQPIFTANCALSNCHAAPNPVQNMNLSAGQLRANTVNVPSNQSALVRIRPLQPDSSYLVRKVEGTHVAAGGFGSRMPLGGTPLSQPEIARIRAWIQAGAEDN